MKETTNWRAGCGRSARPVRREGEPKLSLPLWDSDIAVNLSHFRIKSYSGVMWL